MITVIISEMNSWREWTHRARTKDAQTAIIRAMNKHFPRSYHFIPDDIDNAPVLGVPRPFLPKVSPCLGN
ncbi:TPA: hypothetical protein ACQJT9_004734 [Escherichia coli]